MTTVFPKILLLDDEFRDTARVLYSHIAKRSEELDRWDLNNLVHLLQLLWVEPMQVVNFQNAVISKRSDTECTVIASTKANRGVGNFRISPIKVACCLFRWPKLTEIRRIISIQGCKYKLNSGRNKQCINPYHYQPKLSHYDFQHVENRKTDYAKNQNNETILSMDGVQKVQFMKTKIYKNLRENHVLLATLNSMPTHLVEAVEISQNLTFNPPDVPLLYAPYANNLKEVPSQIFVACSQPNFNYPFIGMEKGPSVIQEDNRNFYQNLSSEQRNLPNEVKYANQSFNINNVNFTGNDKFEYCQPRDIRFVNPNQPIQGQPQPPGVKKDEFQSPKITGNYTQSNRTQYLSRQYRTNQH